MGRNRAKKHKKGFPQCCGRPMKVKQESKSSKVEVHCEVCGEVL